MLSCRVSLCAAYDIMGKYMLTLILVLSSACSSGEYYSYKHSNDSSIVYSI